MSTVKVEFRQVVLNILHQRRHALGVVAAVHHHQRLAAYHLKADGPAHLRQTLPHGVLIDGPAPAAQYLHRSESRSGVAQLHPSQQGQVQAGQ